MIFIAALPSSHKQDQGIVTGCPSYVLQNHSARECSRAATSSTSGHRPPPLGWSFRTEMNILREQHRCLSTQRSDPHRSRVQESLTSCTLLYLCE